MNKVNGLLSNKRYKSLIAIRKNKIIIAQLIPYQRIAIIVDITCILQEENIDYSVDEEYNIFIQ